MEKTLIERAKEVKKISGKDAALDFLFTSKVDVNSDLAAYLDRVKIYATGSQKYSQNLILNVFDQVFAKMAQKDVWQGYAHKAEMLERYCLLEEAKCNYAAAISNLSPDNSSYLLNLYMLERKFGGLCKSVHDKVYWSLISELLMNAWNLSCCMKGSVELWLIRLGLPNSSNTKPSFQFYLRPIQSDSSLYFYENVIDSLQNINSSVSRDIYEGKIREMFIISYPKRLGFKQEYFQSNYSDADFFNEILNLYGRDFDKLFPSKAVSEAIDTVNDFFKEINPS